MQKWLASLLALAAAAELPRQSFAADPATVHTIFSTECNPYFDW